MIDQRVEMARRHRQAKLEHDLVSARHGVERLDHLIEQDGVALRAFRALDVDFGLQHGDEAAGENLKADFDLLLYDGSNTFAVGEVDDRAFLRAEHAERLRLGEKRIELRHRLHQLDAIGFIFQTLVNLDEGHHALVPKRGRGRLAADLTVHRLFKQDRADNLFAGEGG